MGKMSHQANEGHAGDSPPRPGRRARRYRVRRFLSVLGPGVITGASDDDPSGIATYAIAGASLGLATL
jgi:Mn2+/Fe2+ NRAMP family transporter